MRELTDIAARIFGTTSGLIFSKRKDRKTAEARQSLIYYLVTSEGATISHAARMLSLDHSTGHYAMKNVSGLLGTNREFRNKYERLFICLREYIKKGEAPYKIVLCDTITNELFGFVSIEAADRHRFLNENKSYCVYEKKML